MLPGHSEEVLLGFFSKFLMLRLGLFTVFCQHIDLFPYYINHHLGMFFFLQLFPGDLSKSKLEVEF